MLKEDETMQHTGSEKKKEKKVERCIDVSASTVTWDSFYVTWIK